jgi:hypothetical protein
MGLTTAFFTVVHRLAMSGAPRFLATRTSHDATTSAVGDEHALKPNRRCCVLCCHALLPTEKQPMTNRLVSRINQLRFSGLDFKVGFRMLARYPGLTLVGTLAIAVAIALGSLYFEALNKWQNPRLPVQDAERVISIAIGTWTA